MREELLWRGYSRLLKERITKPKAKGLLQPKEGFRLVKGEKGSRFTGNHTILSFLVDEKDGVIRDSKFTVFGETALIGASDIIAELVLGKNYDQAKRVSRELIDTHVRDNPKANAFPDSVISHIDLALEAMQEALSLCHDIPLEEGYVMTPIDFSHLQVGEYPPWETFTEQEKVATLNEVIERDIQPYVKLDEGGVKLKELKSSLEVVIEYEGNCTSCYSSIGSTLSAIQQILRARVHPHIIVTPSVEAWS
ncbi:MAG: iron-sulfur cluster assembly scaffold protein [Verrucomicrobia bacterium]|nr:iron-sulfur cluster assembly scaffold protein [Verrucomicrobiota bacterium]